MPEQSSQALTDPNHFSTLLGLFNNAGIDRRRPGSFQDTQSHRQSFDSIDQELEITPPTQPLTLSRQPNIVQQQQMQEEQEQQAQEQDARRNESLDSTELLELTEVAVPQPLRR